MSPEPANLAALQRTFHDAVLGDDDGALTDAVQSPRGTVAARIAVYRNTVQGSLTDVLAAAFPVVRRIVGAGFFARLAGRFIAAAPPQAPQLCAYGKDFPDFVAAAETTGLAHELPYLADVARLEWARGEAYFAADAAALDPADLTALPPERIAEAVLILHPATRLVRSSYPIHRIWQINQAEITEVPAVDMSAAEAVLLSRPAFKVTVRVISPADAAFVAAVARGANLGDAFAAATAISSGFDGEAALRDHLIYGTFSGVTI